MRKKQLQYTNKPYDKLSLLFVECLGDCFLPLGVTALVLLPLALSLWLGVVKTFLGRAFFLLDAGVLGGGNAKVSTSSEMFSLFSLVCSWLRSLFSWRWCVAARPLFGVGLNALLFSTAGDASLFKWERVLWKVLLAHLVVYHILLENSAGCDQQVSKHSVSTAECELRWACEHHNWTIHFSSLHTLIMKTIFRFSKP